MLSGIFYPPHRSWILLHGPDVQDFLQRLTTIHVKNLSVNEGAPGFFLNPQGKIQAYFQLWRCAAYQNYPAGYAFEFNPGHNNQWKESLISWINRYTFLEKMTWLDLSSELQCIGWLSELPFPDTQPCINRMKNHDLFWLCNQGQALFGQPWITLWGSSQSLQSWISASETKRILSLEELEEARIEHLQPEVDAEITHSTQPLEVGLRKAIHEGKGCYPGQEVIEKIISYGSPPRRLVQIRGQGNTPKPQENIFNLEGGSAPIGKMTSSTLLSTHPPSFLALAIIQKRYAKKDLPVFFETTKAQGLITRVSEPS